MKLTLATILLAGSLANASVTVVVNGSNHTIPQTNEKGWGSAVTAWIQAISSYTLQPSGGTFSLTAEVSTGATYGFKVPYIKTATAVPSTAGVLRLSNLDSLGWRNFANGGNLLLTVDSSDRLLFNGSVVQTTATVTATDNTFYIADDGDATKRIAFQASGITTGTTRTLTAPNSSGTLVLADSTATLTNKTIDADGTGNSITNIENADIKAAAAIAVNKLAALTASRAVVSDGSGFLASATTTATEIGYVNGVTSAIQTQIDAQAAYHTWFVNVNISGANPALGVSAVTAYTEIADSGLTMTPISGSAAAGTMCSSTNAATTPSTSPTTCAAGSESVGVSFTAPVTGTYEVCASFSWGAVIDNAENLAATFELIETPTNAQTLTQEGGDRIEAQATSAAAAQTTIFPYHLCSYFTFASTGVKGIRLMYEQAIGGTPNSSLLVGDTSGNNGQRDMNFKVRRL